MKLKKWALPTALILATFFVIGCGDNKDPRLSDRGAMCLKMQEMGGSCNPTTASATAATPTVTVTQTQTN